jgi:phosphohistidine phosphatase
MTVVSTLHLLRHAKSSWDDATIGDHDRPLAPRGARAARQIADHLSSASVHPALVLCSSARRTVETLDALRSVISETAVVSIEPELYGADASEILELLRTVDPQIREVLVIGHNPGLQDLAIDLAGDEDGAAVDALRTKFPTGALATFDVSVDWAHLGPGHAHLTHFVTPRHLS